MTLLDLLTPVSCDVPKRRFGPARDGGYVIPARSFGEVAVFGYGVGHDASFEDEVAEFLGCKAFVFDHTLGDNIPDIGPNTTFVPEGITAPPETIDLRTFSSHLEKFVGPVGDVFLKIDVEGAEWDVLDFESLDRVTQLVIELHEIDVEVERKTLILEKIREKFDLVHVHGVNFYNQTVFMFNRATRMPRLLECVFVRKGLVETRPCDETYPTPLDAQGHPGKEDVCQDYWLTKSTPINFQVPECHIEALRPLLCPDDTVNAPGANIDFIIKPGDAFPYRTIYALEHIVIHNINTHLMICSKGVMHTEMRILCKNSTRGGVINDETVAIWSS